MKVTILSIGDELLLGEVVDTNAAYIARHLYAAGINLPLQMTVGDKEQDIIEACQALSQKSDAVIVTGGLGPTVDDVTAMAAAKLAGLPLVLNKEALVHLRNYAQRLARDLHPANEKQALMPQDALVMPNPVGTACGFSIKQMGCQLFFLPGVPGEMKPMLEQSVIPSLLSSPRERKALRTKVFKVFGISEAELDVVLQGVTEGFATVSIAFCVNFPEIEVKLRVEEDEDLLSGKTLAVVSGRIRKRLTDYIFAEDAETIDTVVAELFKKTGATLALAESCTGGLIAKRITDISGSSAYFLQGLVTYSNFSKVQLLGVPQQLLEKKGAVSAEVAMAMAQGARDRSESELALAVTGIAGPEGSTAEKPVGTIFMALADETSCLVRHFKFHGDRGQIRLITSFVAMNWLREKLLSPP